MKKLIKTDVLKKGKEVFGSMEKFNMWLNTDNLNLKCKPITLWDKKSSMQVIYDELIRIK